MTGTVLFSDERTFWHCTGVQALFMPLGEWVQAPAIASGADTPDSKRRIINLFRASGLEAQVPIRSAPPATREDLLRIHPASYIDQFKALSDANGGELGFAAPFSKGAFEIASISAGLAKAAIDAVLTGGARNAYALSRPAGHHCLAEQSMGFCLLANIPIAIEAARVAHGLGRVAVIDWDVHHGNGTQSIYYDRDDVLTISLHQDRCFPPGYSGFEERGVGAGAGRNLNIPLHAGAGHDTYLYAFDRLVAPAIRDYRPDLIVVASGLDASAVDPLARMLLHSGSYRALTERVMALAADLCGDRVVVVHEGGYAEAYTPFCGQAIIETLAGVTVVEDPSIDLLTLQQPAPRMVDFHKLLIDEMVGQLGLPA